MLMRLLLGTLALLLGSVALAGPAAAVNIPGCGEFTLVGRDSIILESGQTEITGNLMVASQTGVIEIGRFNTIHGTISANTLRLGNNAQVDVCQGNIFQGVDENTVCGTVQPFVFPTCIPPAFFNPPAVDACVNSAPNLTVPAGQTATLVNGDCRGLVTLGIGAILNVSGTINVRQIQAGASSRILGPATINILNGFASGAGIVTDSITFNSRGTSGNAINLGNNSQYIDTLFNVPIGGIHIRANSSFVGDTELVARRVLIQPLRGGAEECELTVDKVCDVNAAPPFTVNFAGSVTNMGTTAVTLSVVNDKPIANTPLTCAASLPPGGTCNFTGSYVPVVQVPPFTDTVTATGTTASGATCTATGSATCAPAPGNGVCPEDDAASAGGSRECDRCVILADPNNFCPGKPTHATWQDAINSASAGDVICVYTDTKETVNIPGPADLTITQCTTAKVTAADPTKPVVTIRSTASNVLIIGADTVGGSIGWCLDPGATGHELKSVRASSATKCGILDRGSLNTINFNKVESTVPGAGVCIGATQSTIDGSRVEHNSIGVIFDSAIASVFKDARVQFNGPTAPAGATAGIVVRANSSGNVVRDNRCDGNVPPDPDIANFGVGTSLISNQCALPPPAGVNPAFVMPSNCN